MGLDHLLVREAVAGELLDLCARHAEPRVGLELGDVVVVQVVLQEGTATVHVETDALKYGSLLQFARAEALSIKVLVNRVHTPLMQACMFFILGYR